MGCHGREPNDSVELFQNEIDRPYPADAGAGGFFWRNDAEIRGLSQRGRN
jgi:hypothetical protein